VIGTKRPSVCHSIAYGKIEKFLDTAADATVAAANFPAIIKPLVVALLLYLTPGVTDETVFASVADIALFDNACGSRSL
jgi:hypothetical protein